LTKTKLQPHLALLLGLLGDAGEEEEGPHPASLQPPTFGFLKNFTVFFYFGGRPKRERMS
jgi:hypothetical protein